jgi:AraC-like DNA-binding protein
MLDRTISTAWVKGIREILTNASLDASAIFKEAGLDLADLNNPETRFAPEKISRLWEIAAQRSGNPALGLTLPESSTPATLDAVAFVMMSCPNLLVGLERLIRYVRIISDAAELTVVQEDDGYALTIELFTGGRAVPRQRAEFVVLTLLNACRWITGHRVVPLRVDLVDPPPVDMQPYIETFQCPLTFNAPIHRIFLSRADAMLPVPTSNPAMAEMHDRLAVELLGRMEDEDRISHKTRELIMHRLRDGEPLRADVAKELCMSERTLQRRLQDEGTSYHQLVDDTRREIAQQYLMRNNVTIAQIAYLLGFCDQSNFFRACKRWFDVSPGEYRNNLKRNTPGALVPDSPATP